MSEAQQQQNHSEGTRIAIVPTSPSSRTSPNVQISIPASWAKWIKDNLPLLIVCGYLGGDRLLTGYLSAPQDIVDIKTALITLNERFTKIEKQLAELLYNKPASQKER